MVRKISSEIRKQPRPKEKTKSRIKKAEQITKLTTRKIISELKGLTNIIPENITKVIMLIPDQDYKLGAFWLFNSTLYYSRSIGDVASKITRGRYKELFEIIPELASKYKIDYKTSKVSTKELNFEFKNKINDIKTILKPIKLEILLRTKDINQKIVIDNTCVQHVFDNLIFNSLERINEHQLRKGIENGKIIIGYDIDSKSKNIVLKAMDNSSSLSKEEQFENFKRTYEIINHYNGSINYKRIANKYNLIEIKLPFS